MKKIFFVLFFLSGFYATGIVSGSDGTRVYDNADSDYIEFRRIGDDKLIYLFGSKGDSIALNFKECQAVIRTIEKVISIAKSKKKVSGTVLEDGYEVKEITDHSSAWADTHPNGITYHPLYIGWELNYKHPWPYVLGIHFRRVNPNGYVSSYEFSPERATVFLNYLKQFSEEISKGH